MAPIEKVAFDRLEDPVGEGPEVEEDLLEGPDLAVEVEPVPIVIEGESALRHDTSLLAPTVCTRDAPP
jgi:hypothetical protein